MLGTQTNLPRKKASTLCPLPDDWMQKLGAEFEKPYMKKLKTFLKDELDQQKIIYPPAPEIFNAFHFTPFGQVKVVIIGQDPYHGEGQAHGLCFSVRPGVRPPPSLKNIYKELQAELDLPIVNHGDLSAWAKQGVLLLNNVLTVEKARPASHKGQGWEEFTDRVVETLNTEKKNLVFLLWGSHAQKKGATIDRKKHLVLESPHPSPFSAHRGFLGNNHFIKTNEYLMAHEKIAIQWALSQL